MNYYFFWLLFFLSFFFFYISIKSGSLLNRDFDSLSNEEFIAKLKTLNPKDVFYLIVLLQKYILYNIFSENI